MERARQGRGVEVASAGSDLGVALLSGGVVAVPGLLAASDRDRAAAEEAWSEFERRVAAFETPLAQASRRFRLGRFDLRCVVLALSRHLEPRMTTVLGRLAQKRLELGIPVGLALDVFCRSTVERVEARRAFQPHRPWRATRGWAIRRPVGAGGRARPMLGRTDPRGMRDFRETVGAGQWDRPAERGRGAADSGGQVAGIAGKVLARTIPLETSRASGGAR